MNCQDIVIFWTNHQVYLAIAYGLKYLTMGFVKPPTPHTVSFDCINGLNNNFVFHVLNIL